MRPALPEAALIIGGVWKGMIFSMVRDADVISNNHRYVNHNKYVFISDLTEEEKELYIMLFPALEKEIRNKSEEESC